MPNPGYFGPLVIGDEQFESERNMYEEQRIKFGPLVTGEGQVNIMADELVDLTIESVKEKLEANPQKARHLFVAEEGRDEGPRKEALEAIVEAAIYTGDGVTENRVRASLNKMESAEKAESDADSTEGDSTEGDSPEGDEDPEEG